jgi:hypothetical protein
VGFPLLASLRTVSEQRLVLQWGRICAFKIVKRKRQGDRRGGGTDKEAETVPVVDDIDMMSYVSELRHPMDLLFISR